MKSIYFLNWVLIAIYLFIFIFSVLDLNRPGMDAAGRGMAQGFLLIGAAFIVLLIVLNLIPLQWVRIIGLVLGIIPLFYMSKGWIGAVKTKAFLARQAEANNSFQNTHWDQIANAITQHNVEEVKALLQKDASEINLIKQPDRRTLLDLAVYQTVMDKDNPEVAAIVTLLLEYKADPNFFPAEDGPAHSRYATMCPTSVFRQLLEAGGDPNITGENDLPLIYKLIGQPPTRYYDKLEIALEHGADPNSPQGNEKWQINSRPLIHAASHEAWKVCELLIDKGAEVNFKPAGEYPDFWHFYEEAGRKYETAGRMPEDYQQLKTNAAIRKGKE